MQSISPASIFVIFSISNYSGFELFSETKELS